jgi:hypothetical protein
MTSQNRQTDQWNKTESSEMITPTLFLFLGEGAGMGCDFRASCLQSSCSTAWATPLAHFSLVIFGDWVSMNYLPRLASSMILLTSASWVAKITGMSHHCQATFIYSWDWCQNMLEKKMSSSTNDTRKTGYSHREHWNYIPTSHSVQTLTQSDSQILM